MSDTGLSDKLIQHLSEWRPTPPAHSGTVNRRLVGREFGAGFEMVLGQVAPGAGEPALPCRGGADVTSSRARPMWRWRGAAPLRPRHGDPYPKGLAHRL
jgi:hypothetical protein